jgi:O-antigen/teichoic acid export membrane protein
MKSDQFILSRNTLFDSESRGMNLAGKTAAGGLFSAASQATVFIVNTGGTAILARILVPAEFGIVGMAFVVISFAKVLIEAGLGLITVQEDTISHRGVSNLFWANVVVGFILTGVVCGLSPVISLFFETPELTRVTLLLSLSFLIGGFGVQHSALLRRHMRFGAIASIDLAAAISDRIVGILMALSGMSYWAIVAGALVASTIRIVGPFFFCRWKPGRFAMDLDLTKKLKSGLNITIANIFVFLNGNFDKIIIGKALGQTELGLYSKAYRLFMLPINEILRPLVNVSVPALSAVQNNELRFQRYTTKLADLVATLTFPVTLFCLLEAKLIIGILLGPNWMGAVPAFQALAVAGFFVPVGSVQGIVLLSLGQTKKYLFYQMTLTIAIVVGVLIGTTGGLIGVSIGYSVANIAVFLPRSYFAFSGTPVSVVSYLIALLKPLGITMAIGVVAFVYPVVASNDAPWIHLLASIVFFGGVFIFSWRRESVKAIRKSLKAKIDTQVEKEL